MKKAHTKEIYEMEHPEYSDSKYPGIMDVKQLQQMLGISHYLAAS